VLESVQVKAAAQTAVLIKKLRAAWLTLMDERINNPTGAFTSHQRSVLEVISDLLHDAVG
jgi:hypothetical protein